MKDEKYHEFFGLTDHQGELIDALESEEEGALEAAKRVQLSTHERIDAVAARAIFWGAQCEALQAKYKPILDAIHAELAHAKQRQEACKNYLMQLLPADPEAEYVGANVRLYYRTTPSVDVLDEASVPFEFTRTITEIDKRAVEKELKAGKEVPGCRLTQRYSLQIAEGGLKGKALAKARQKRLAQRTVEHDQKSNGVQSCDGAREISAGSKETSDTGNR